MPLEGEIAAGVAVHEASTTGIHGVGAGVIVGTTLAQTLTNKTLTSPTINGTIATTGLTMPAFTLGGAVAINGQTFDAGAGSAKITTTTSNQGVEVESSGDPHGPALTLAHNHDTPQVAAILAQIIFEGYDGAALPIANNLGVIQAVYTNVTDTTEALKLTVVLFDAGAQNLALELSGAGVLDVDASSGLGAATVGLFDDLDDAVILKRGISERQLETLEKVGVMRRKHTGSGWMLNIQAMLYLLAGGIYQNRARIDELTRLIEQGGSPWQKELRTP